MFAFRNRRQIEVRPAVLLQQMANEIVDMEALHDHDDGVLGLVVETGEQRVGVPLLGTFACCFRIGILRLHGIVDDDEVAAAAGERAADRGRQPVASERGRELQLGVLGRADPGVRKQAIVQRRAHDRAAVVGVFAGESFRIADANDPPPRVMAEDKGRECDRGADRFETARRHRDDQALDLTLAARASERRRWPRCANCEANASLGETIGKIACMKAVEVVPKDRGDDVRICRHDFASLCWEVSVSSVSGLLIAFSAVVCVRLLVSGAEGNRRSRRHHRP